MNNTKLVVLDTETTGLTQPIGVVEVADIHVDLDLNVLDEHVRLVNPGIAVEPGATAIHGITDTDVVGAPSLDSALAHFKGVDLVLIGHNIQFDIKLVQAHLNIVGELCTLAASRRYIIGSVDHKLSTLRDYLGLPNSGSHRALHDAHSSLNVLRFILANSKVTLDQMIKRHEKPRMLSHMPFGEHGPKNFPPYGKPIIQVPRQYRKWLMDKGENAVDKDMWYTLNKLKDV